MKPFAFSSHLRALAALSLGAGLACPALGAPPPTRVERVTDTIQGLAVGDDYRWLEGDNSNPAQMGRVNPEVTAWTDAQNAYTRSILDNLPGRKELEDKLRPLMEIGSVSAPAMRGNRYFYTKREGKENQPRVFVREGSAGTPRLLLDPAQIDPSGLTTVSGFFPSLDGKLMSFGTYRSGDENTTTFVMNVDTGDWFPDEIPGKSQVVQWMPDNSGFFYERLEDVKDPYSARIKFHKLGTHQRMDPLLFRQYTREENEKLATTWGPGASIDKECRWMALTYYTGTASNDIWAVDLNAWRQTGKFEKVTIKEGENNVFGGEIIGDTLYMLTDYKAPNKRLVAVDMKHPDEGSWVELIPENKNAVLTGFGIAKGIIAADYEENASTRLALFDMHGKSLGDLKLPGIGSGGLATEDDRTEAYLSFTSYNYPSTIFRVDLANASDEPKVWERPDVPVDPSIIEVKQEWCTSKDGTKVPMFIVHKKGLTLDGNNPTILNGYGGFNISMTPSFSATLFPWFEAGGVFAVANLRGGGEFGKAWHEGGMNGSKQNVFDDMIAAAEHLIAQKYTTPKRLAATGGSNGGLLMGAMMTQRPDLFGAIICAVPLLDMYRYQHFLMARYWVPEYGDADDAKSGAFAWLQKYSPYHNISSDRKYPGILFTAGENDTRVHALHARKMAAAMQAVTGSQPDARPVLLWVDRDAGHGQGKPLNLRIRDAADQRMFLMWQLGMLPTQATELPNIPANAQKTASEQHSNGPTGVGSNPGVIGTSAGNVLAAAPSQRVSLTPVTLSVQGMHCELCAGKVRTTLKKVKGVKDADVKLDAGVAEVTLDETNPASTEALLAAFAKSDFTVRVKDAP